MAPHKPRYRKVSVEIWNDATFRSLSAEGALVFLFLLTHPHLLSVGAMRATAEGLAAELKAKLSPERFAKGFQEGLREGLFLYDPDACFLALPNFVKHNIPDNPNVAASMGGKWADLPDCEAKTLYFQQVKRFLERLPKPLGEPFGQGYPNQEQEQEQEQETYKNPPKPPLGGGGQSGASPGEPDPEPLPPDEPQRGARSGLVAVVPRPVDAPLVEEASTRRRRRPRLSAEEEAGILDDCAECWRAWLETIPQDERPPGRDPTQAEEREYLARRREGCSASDLLDAVRGWRHDEWEGRSRHNAFLTLLKSRDSVAKFARLQRTGGAVESSRYRVRRIDESGALV